MGSLTLLSNGRRRVPRTVARWWCVGPAVGGWMLVVWCGWADAGAASVVAAVDDLRAPVAAVRVHAAMRLGQSGKAAAVPALITALADKDAAVRREAAKGLGYLRDMRAGTALTAVLDDPEANVRAYAAYALGELQFPDAVGPLVTALGDPDWVVRDQAAWALREIGGPSVVEGVVSALEKPNADAEHILWVLQHAAGSDAVAALARALAAADSAIRLGAVAALGDIGTPAVVTPLLGALNDREASVRREAVEALGEIADERAEPALNKLAAGDDDARVREAAEAALVGYARRGGLAAHWSFDDHNRGFAKDVAGGGIDGKIIGCRPVEGKVGAALEFGEGRYVELDRPTGLPIANQAFTVMAWARPAAATGVVVARGGAFCGYSLYLKDGLPKFGIHRTQDGPGYIAAGSKPITPGSWVHLAGVVRSDRIQLYLNGALCSETKTTGFLPSDCGQGMEIGFDVSNSAAEITDPFTGVIDEVRCYATALSADEIAKQCQPAK